MSDLRAPGNPGGTRGKSEPQKNSAPITSTNQGTSDSTGRSSVDPCTPGKTSGRKGNPVR
jgi:hypothetical protein